jgi:PAB-dependent poly(A)-specific ribonuclease subunit 3
LNFCILPPYSIRSLQENVGGTTYFYSQEDLNSHGGAVLPNFTVYPGLLPHIAHMKTKSNQPSFFMPDEMKMDILNKQSLTLMQMDPEHLSRRLDCL